MTKRVGSGDAGGFFFFFSVRGTEVRNSSFHLCGRAWEGT